MVATAYDYTACAITVGFAIPLYYVVFAYTKHHISSGFQTMYDRLFYMCMVNVSLVLSSRLLASKTAALQSFRISSPVQIFVFQGLWSHLLFTFGFRVAYIGFWPIYASISPQVASVWHFLMFSSLQNSGMGDVLLAFYRTCVVVFETYYSLFSSERVLVCQNLKCGPFHEKNRKQVRH